MVDGGSERESERLEPETIRARLIETERATYADETKGERRDLSEPECIRESPTPGAGRGFFGRLLAFSATWDSDVHVNAIEDLLLLAAPDPVPGPAGAQAAEAREEDGGGALGALTGDEDLRAREPGMAGVLGELGAMCGARGVKARAAHLARYAAFGLRVQKLQKRWPSIMQIDTVHHAVYSVDDPVPHRVCQRSRSSTRTTQVTQLSVQVRGAVRPARAAAPRPRQLRPLRPPGWPPFPPPLYVLLLLCRCCRCRCRVYACACVRARIFVRMRMCMRACAGACLHVCA
jgi:hypothetical protein